MAASSAAARRMLPTRPNQIHRSVSGPDQSPSLSPARAARRNLRPAAGSRQHPSAWPRSPPQTYGAPSPDQWCPRRARKSCCRMSPAWCRQAAPPILQTTYAEHARAAAPWPATTRSRWPTRSSLRHADLAIVVNPNNPDGPHRRQGQRCSSIAKRPASARRYSRRR